MRLTLSLRGGKREGAGRNPAPEHLKKVPYNTKHVLCTLPTTERMNMKYETSDVTPQQAEAWLAKNADFQRKLRDSVVDKYARDMINGQWQLTHQGIAFDAKGRLIDGQHRLAAVVKAGIPVKMLVVKDSPATAYDHLDLGYGRTAVDILKAQGEGWITNEWIAVARFMEAGANIKAVFIARSPFELREMVETHKNALAFVFQNVERKVRGVTIAPVLAAVAVAYYIEKDRVKLAEFLRLLVSGVALNPKVDSTVIRLRDSLRDDMVGANTMARISLFLKTQRVVKAYMDGESLSKLYTPSEPCYRLKRMATASA